MTLMNELVLELLTLIDKVFEVLLFQFLQLLLLKLRDRLVVVLEHRSILSL